MPHVTFIHGIANKPAPDVLHDLWLRSLAHDNGVDLGAEGVTSSMVYWADVLYESPDTEGAYESAGEFESGAAIPPKEDFAIDMSWRDKLTANEKKQVEALVQKLGFEAAGEDDFAPPVEEIGPEFERIPLPWWLKRRLMEALLRDVHHYLFNTEHSPRPGETYRVQDEIRQRTVAALQEGSARPGPHIVMSHSMGTVIAYDCLKRVAGSPQVDALMTIGSPLGLDEIQDLMKPEWSRKDGFPADRVAGTWANIFDRLDPVAGFDPKLSNDYQRGGAKVIADIHEPNWGKWRHNISKYLSGTDLRSQLRAMLGI
jgi:hypothetical protein